jgi:hypothetical protein
MFVHNGKVPASGKMFANYLMNYYIFQKRMIKSKGSAYATILA